MMNKELYEKFKNLSSERTSKGGIRVIPVLDTNHKLGVSKEGFPKFFICTSDWASATPDTTLEILSVEYNIPCTFVDDDDVSVPHHYTVIVLRSTDEALQEYFLDILCMMVGRMAAVPSKRDIAIEVEKLIAIFAAMKNPPRRMIQGLWTELLVIERSYLPETLINAWHESPSDKYDFTMGRDKIEVKSTDGENRIHQFSLDQLSPSEHSRVVVASAIVRPSAHGQDGLSVYDLYEKILQKVHSDSTQMRLMKLVAETVGTDFHCLREKCFDYTGAVDTLRFYDQADVPRIGKDSVPPGVTGVTFKSDLSGIPDIRSAAKTFQRADSPLYKSLFE